MPCPEPRTKSKCNATLNAKAAADCITDDAILEDLKKKKLEKAEAKKEKEEKKIEKNRRKRVTKQLERECKKKIREKKQLDKEHKKVVRI